MLRLSRKLTAPVVATLLALSSFGRAASPPNSRDGAILLGCAMRTISPPLGMPLVGYPRPRPNTGVALDLCARAAVFGAPGNPQPVTALVVLDLIHIDAALGKAIRERAAAALPGLAPAAILVSATHTHSGPAVSPRGAKDTDAGGDPAYLNSVAAAASEAVVAAWSSKLEVRARVGHGIARLGHNRRVVDSSGHATNEWKDVEGLHSGIFNPDVPFVAFDDARTGDLQFIFVSYGCHPVTLGPGNTQVSADYPGYLVRALESATHARLAIFFTGAAANINPRDGLYPDPEHARPMGEALAAVVLVALPQARPLKSMPIAVTSVPLPLSVRPELAERFAARTQDFPEGRRVVTEVQALRLGELALISSPGELVAELGIAVQNSSPFDQTLIVYNANDHLGYLITDAIRREGGYEANSAVSLDFEKPYLNAARAALARVALEK